MNVVRICFQASYTDSAGRRRQLSPVLSEPIFDKSASPGGDTSVTKGGTCHLGRGMCHLGPPEPVNWAGMVSSPSRMMVPPWCSWSPCWTKVAPGGTWHRGDVAPGGTGTVGRLGPPGWGWDGVWSQSSIQSQSQSDARSPSKCLVLVQLPV